MEKEFREARTPISTVGTRKQAGAKLKTSTVMFVEFSRGGSLQKSMKQVLDRLAPMLGFKVRVTEKGGSSLGSLLSNKNLWSGEPCGRESCKPCTQPGDKKEPCKARNIVYESECTLCNEPGSRKLADRDGLKEKKEQANLYVGETARSLSERAGEHWDGAMGGKEENHMLEHLSAAHKEEQVPSFRFKVVKKCKTALERQVREAVRIEMRGNILNKKGMFNRCKLTRMVVDTEWDKEVWDAAWEEKPEEEINLDSMKDSGKSKSSQDGRGAAKRVKREESGVTWGEQVSPVDRARDEFMLGAGAPVAKPVQSELRVYSGVEWVVRELVKECSHRAVEQVELMEGVEQWEEWEYISNPNPRTEDPHGKPRRTDKEESYLWAMLKEIDKELSKHEKKEQAKKLRGVAKARKKMGADKSQPSIDGIFRSKNSKVARLASSPCPTQVQVQPRSISRPESEGGSRVNTHTGTKCNIVSRLECEGGSSVHTQTGTQCNTVKDEAREAASLEPVGKPSQVPAPASPRSGAQECDVRMCQEYDGAKKNDDEVEKVLSVDCMKNEMPSMSVAELSNMPTEQVQRSATISKNNANKSSSASNFENLGCKPKVKFCVQTVSRGKFKLGVANGGPASSESQQIEINNKNSASSSTNRKAASSGSNEDKHTQLIVTTNTSLGKATPSKRKVFDEGGGEVKSLVCIFNHGFTKPTWGDRSESPAKKQRCGS